MNAFPIQQWHAQLASGQINAVRALPLKDTRRQLVDIGESAATDQLIFSGTFDPLHAGHRTMADVAEEIVGRPLAFEISIENVDKPPVEVAALIGRLEQFPPQQTVWLTRAARFTEKAACFPGATFVVGVDTIERIGDACYYEQDKGRCQAAIDELAGHGCRFLVFGRARDNRFLTLASLKLPPSLIDLCDEVSQSRFRHDISSTQLRIASEERKDSGLDSN